MEKRSGRENGFSLMEILLVVVIIGAVIAVILPRAFRAKIETKYEILRQTGTELASWANEWAVRELEAQPSVASSELDDYIQTLAETNGNFDWVADLSNNSNWQAPLENVANRGGVGIGSLPNISVLDIMPKNKLLLNPFSGLSIFQSANNPATNGNAITGAMACAYMLTGSGNYYALIFQGTDSINITGANAFYAGQDKYSDPGSNNIERIQGLRSGIYINTLQ
jgi:prepilin-type N-terminal cleavage/methylation domain-containing protein